MFLRMLLALAVLYPLLTPPACGEEGGEGALAAIPSDALAFLCVPSLQSADRDIQQMIKSLGLNMMVPLPDDSLIALLKQRLPDLEGMDESGPLILLALPANEGSPLKLRPALMIAAENPTNLLQAMDARQGDGGIWSAEILGRPVHATIRDRFVVMGAERDIVKQIKDCADSVTDKLAKPVRSAASTLDALVWIDAARVAELIQPLVRGKLYPLMEAEAGNSPWEKKQIELNKKQMEIFFDGVQQMCLGVDLQPEGVLLRGLMTAKQASELDKMTEMTVTDQPLLYGLGEPLYVLATGQAADRKQMEVIFENNKVYFGLFEDLPGIDEEKLSQLKNTLREWFLLTRGTRMALVPLDGGPAGLIGLTVLADTTDSDQWMELTGTSIALMRAMVLENASERKEEIKRMLQAVTYQPASEQITEAKVAHLRLDLEELGVLDEDWIEHVSDLIGEEGVLLRIAAVDPKTVLFAAGGGPQRFASLVGQARDGDRALAEAASIRAADAHLPQQRNSVMYLAVDNGLQLAQNVLDAIDEDQLPFNIPKIDKPVGIASTGGGNWSQFDLFLPVEVVSAGKSITMTMMGVPQPVPSE